MLVSSIQALRTLWPLPAPGSLQGLALASTCLLRPHGLRAHSLPPSQGLEQDVLQAIGRAIEAVHNAAVRDGGKQPGAARGPPVSVLGASQWARGWVLPRL